MFGLFKKDPVAKLRKQREQLLKEAFDMSKIDRTKSDALMAKADEIEKKIIQLTEKS